MMRDIAQDHEQPVKARLRHLRLGESWPRFNGDQSRLPLWQRDEWLALLREHCLASHDVLLAETDDCRWPLLAGRDLGALANYYSFAWAPVGSDIEAWIAIAEALRSSHATMTLGPVPAEGGIADRLDAALRCGGWRTIMQPTGMNHWVDVEDRRFAAWWAERPGALRSTVRRKGKKGDVDCQIHRAWDAALWRDYETVYQSSWKPAEGFPGFLRAMAQAAAERGALRLGVARIEGRAVAVQFWTVEAGIASIHKLAHLEGVEAWSPGTLLTHRMYEAAFDVDRVRRIDFGTGDDGYKRDWMERSAPLMTIRAFNPAAVSAWPRWARASMSRLAARASHR